MSTHRSRLGRPAGAARDETSGPRFSGRAVCRRQAPASHDCDRGLLQPMHRPPARRVTRLARPSGHRGRRAPPMLADALADLRARTGSCACALAA